MLQTYWIPPGYRNKSRFPPSANVVGSSPTAPSFTDGIFDSVATPAMASSPASLPFTAEQCQQLLSLIHAPSVPSEAPSPSAAHMVQSHNVSGGIYPMPSHFSS